MASGNDQTHVVNGVSYDSVMMWLGADGLVIAWAGWRITELFICGLAAFIAFAGFLFWVSRNREFQMPASILLGSSYFFASYLFLNFMEVSKINNYSISAFLALISMAAHYFALEYLILDAQRSVAQLRPRTSPATAKKPMPRARKSDA